MLEMLLTSTLTVAGLVAFETISSIDNAIINAEVLNTMSARARRWFLFWGILFAVLAVRGLLPWLIIWLSAPGLGPVDAFTAMFSHDPAVGASIQAAAPALLMGGGTFLVLLFMHWLFLEQKHFGLAVEQVFMRHGAWFFTLSSLLTTALVWATIDRHNGMALGVMIGSSAFFISHGFKQHAEEAERTLSQSGQSDIAKILYLEVIDATFSIDGVLGAFAFTLSVPLILIGNGIGAIVVRQLTVGNIERIKQYRFLKNGAMYSILILGVIMIGHAFGRHIPEWVSPVSTFAVIGYFFWRSRQEVHNLNP